MPTDAWLGNAKIQGLTEELDMHGSDYNIALFIFCMIQPAPPLTSLDNVPGLPSEITPGGTSQSSLIQDNEDPSPFHDGLR